MVNVNNYLRFVSGRVKHVFDFFDHPYQSRCFKLRKPIFNFCICQTTIEKQNKFDVFF